MSNTNYTGEKALSLVTGHKKICAIGEFSTKIGEKLDVLQDSITSEKSISSKFLNNIAPDEKNKNINNGLKH